MFQFENYTSTNSRWQRTKHDDQGRRSLWDRGDYPNFYEGGTSMVISPPNIFEVMSFRMSTRVTATVVCCILTQILCVVSQKKLQLLGDEVLQTPYRGFAPGPHWGPQTPSLLLCPPIILWDRHPCLKHICSLDNWPSAFSALEVIDDNRLCCLLTYLFVY